MQRIILSIFILLIFSCNNPYQQNAQKQETPKALENKNSSSEILSKRADDDLVESLYDEIVDKDKDLKALENKIKELNEGENDSVSAFQNFSIKNQDYYSSASMHLNTLHDSSLKEKMKLLIDQSLRKYNNSVSGYDALLEKIQEQNIALSDLHTVLKISKTLSVIEIYQKKNLPPAKPLQNLIDKQNQSIKLIDTLVKK